MLVKVSAAKYIKEYIVEVTFNDGIRKKIDLKDYLKGPVFKKLEQVEYFKKFTLNRWTIEWDNGADLAPEFLYDLAMKQDQKKGIAR